MDENLIRIKRAVLAGRLVRSMKADREMAEDGLGVFDVMESIVNARSIRKMIRSVSLFRAQRRETLFVILNRSLGGTPIYTKGKLQRTDRGEVYYVLVSAKRAD